MPWRTYTIEEYERLRAEGKIPAGPDVTDQLDQAAKAQPAPAPAPQPQPAAQAPAPARPLYPASADVNPDAAFGASPVGRALAPRPDWRATARTDPQIQAWWSEMRQLEGLPEGADVVQHMEESAKRPDGYNYATAIEAGLRPDTRDPGDKLLHWGGRDPRTGEILKGPEHPTRALSEADTDLPERRSAASMIPEFGDDRDMTTEQGQRADAVANRVGALIADPVKRVAGAATDLAKGAGVALTDAASAAPSLLPRTREDFQRGVRETTAGARRAVGEFVREPIARENLEEIAAFAKGERADLTPEEAAQRLQPLADWLESQGRGAKLIGTSLARGLVGETSVRFWSNLAGLSGQLGFDDLAETFEKRAELTEQQAAALFPTYEGPDTKSEVVSKTFKAGGEAVGAIAEIAPIAKMLGSSVGMGVHGAVTGYAQGGLKGALSGGVHGLLLGRFLHDANAHIPSRAGRAAAVGTVFGAPTAAAGGSPMDTAIDTFIGAGLGAMGKNPRRYGDTDLMKNPLAYQAWLRRNGEVERADVILRDVLEREMGPEIADRFAARSPAARDAEAAAAQPPPPELPPPPPPAAPQAVPVGPPAAPTATVPPAPPRAAPRPVPPIEAPRAPLPPPTARPVQAKVKPPAAPGLSEHIVLGDGTPPRTGQPIMMDAFKGTGREDPASAYGAGANGPILGPGEYFAFTRETAADYGPKVEKRAVALMNPYVIETGKQLSDALGGPIPTENAKRGPVMQALRERLEAAGHDGVIVNIRGDEKRLRELFGTSQAIKFGAARPEPIPAIKGNKTSILVPGGGTFGARYAAVELEQLIPSNDPFSFQPNPRYAVSAQQRDYGSPAEQQKVIVGGNTFDPGRFYDPGASALDGPPVVTLSGQVLGGNGRTMMATRAEAAKPGTLKAAALEAAEKFGVDRAAVEGMNRPIIVRMHGDEPTGRAFHEMSARLNESSALELGPREFAVNAAKRLTDRTLESVRDAVDRSSAEAPTVADVLAGDRAIVTALERDGIITNQNRARFVVLEGPGAGTLNQDGRAMVARALLSRVIPDKDVQDALPAAFTNRVTRSVPTVLSIEAEFPEVKILEKLDQVAKSEVARAASGQKLQDFFQSQALLDETLAPSQRDQAVGRLHKFLLENGDKATADAFATYRDALRQQKVQGGGLFGEEISPKDLEAHSFRVKGPEDVSALYRLSEETIGKGKDRAWSDPKSLKRDGWKEESHSADLHDKFYDTVVWRRGNETLIEYRPLPASEKFYDLPRVVVSSYEQQVAMHKALGVPMRGIRIPGGEDGKTAEPLAMLDTRLKELEDKVRTLDEAVEQTKPVEATDNVLGSSTKRMAGPLYVPMREARPAQPGEKVPKDIQRRAEAIVGLARALGQSVQLGRRYWARLPKSVLGYFRHRQPGHGELRLLTGPDIQVYAHETMHFLTHFGTKSRQFKYPKWRAFSETKDPALAAELLSISYDVDLSSPAKIRLSIEEGAAEGLRLWLTQPAELYSRAPLAGRKLDTLVNEMPKHQRQAFYDFREAAEKYFEQGSRAEMRAAIGNDGVPIESILETSLDAKRQSILDDLHSILRAERILEGGPKADGAFEVARRMRGAHVVAEAIYHLGAPVWTDRANLGITFEGKSLREILAPEARNTARLDDFFDFAIGVQAREIEALGMQSGFSKQAIKDAIALGDQKGNESFKTTFKELKEFQEKVADFAEEAGLFTKQSRLAWRRKEYAFGFFREMMRGRAAEGTRGGEGMTSVSAIRRMKGSGRNLRDPLTNLMEGPRNLILSAMENQARLKIADELFNRKGGGLFGIRVGERNVVKTFATKRIRERIEEEANKLGIDTKDLNLLESDIPMMDLWFTERPTGWNVMTVLRDGKPEFYEVFDGGLVRSIMSLRRPAKTGIMSWANAVRGASQKTITLAPDFIVRNLLRDTLMASVMSRTGLQHVTDSWRGVWHAVRNDKVYRDFVANGGGGGTLYDSPKARRKDLIRFARRHKLDPRRLIITPMDGLRFLEALGRSLEMGPRTAEYQRGVKKGMTKTHAAYLGREVSTDFSVHGQGGVVNFLGSTFPFFNAMMASSDRFYRALGTDPTYKAMTAARIGAYAMASMALHIYNRGIDEYNDQPDWARNGYHHFPVLTGFDEDTGKPKYDFWRLPRIWEVGVVASVAERIADTFLDPEKFGYGEEDGSLAMDVLRIVMQNYQLTPPPPILQLIEASMNKKWFTGAPIDTVGSENRRSYQSYNTSTSRASRAYGEAVRNAPIPEQLKSPAMAEAMVRGLFNHFASYGLLIGDMMTGGTAEKHPDELPLIRSFYARGEKYSRTVDEWYKTLEEAKKVYGSIKKNIDDDREDLVAEDEKNILAGLWKPLNRMNTKIQAMNREIREIDMDPSMDRRQKAYEIDRLRQEARMTMREGLDMVREARKEYEE